MVFGVTAHHNSDFSGKLNTAFSASTHIYLSQGAYQLLWSHLHRCHELQAFSGVRNQRKGETASLECPPLTLACAKMAEAQGPSGVITGGDAWKQQTSPVTLHFNIGHGSESPKNIFLRVGGERLWCPSFPATDFEIKCGACAQARSGTLSGFIFRRCV